MGLRDRIGGGGLRGGGAKRYKMQEKMFSIGDDAWIEDENGSRVFKADGKALRLRSTFVLEDASGDEVASIQQKVAHIKETMEIERGGRRVAMVKKALISPLRDRFVVNLESGGEWDIKGNILAHEYEITGDGGKVAEVSMKWFRVRDTYGIEVSPGQDEGLVLAVAVALDEIQQG